MAVAVGDTPMLVAGAALLCLGVATLVAVVRPSVVAVLLVVVLAVGWITVDTPVNGPILVAFDDEHGIHAEDLASVGAVLAAGGMWLARRRR